MPSFVVFVPAPSRKLVTYRCYPGSAPNTGEQLPLRRCSLCVRLGSVRTAELTNIYADFYRHMDAVNRLAPVFFPPKL